MKARARIVSVVVALAAMTSVVRPGVAAPTTIRGAIVSYDGVKIVYNLFLPDSPGEHPIIFMTHGWGGAGQRTATGTVKTLLDSDYAVITWDARGFGASGGDAFVDDPGHEGRDLSELIDLVAKRTDIEHDAPNDPRMGMLGGSYAGGIQLAGAAFDARVDAIVPQITWNDLRYALFPGGVVKLGFDQLLYGAGLAGAIPGGITDAQGPAGPQTGNYSTDLHAIEARGLVNGYGDDDTMAWFKGRSVAGYGFGHPVQVPTMLMQGNVDTLFNVNEALANYAHVLSNGAPAKLVVFCGGHVSCPSNYAADTSGHQTDLILSWFDRYVRGNPVSTGAPVEYFTNDGRWVSASSFNGSSSMTVEGSGTIVSSGAKTSALNGKAGVTYATPSSASDPGTLTIPTGLSAGDTILGKPSVSLSLTGVGTGTHLFVKLVDRELNQVVDLQEAAIRVEGIPSGTSKLVTFDGVAVNYTVPAGHHIDVQVASSSTAMMEYRGAALLTPGASVSIPYNAA